MVNLLKRSAQRYVLSLSSSFRTGTPPPHTHTHTHRHTHTQCKLSVIQIDLHIQRSSPLPFCHLKSTKRTMCCDFAFWTFMIKGQYLRYGQKCLFKTLKKRTVLTFCHRQLWIVLQRCLAKLQKMIAESCWTNILQIRLLNDFIACSKNSEVQR